MSYTAHAYRDMSGIFSGQVDEITGSLHMTEDEVEIAVETVQIIVSRVADVFEKDNPHGFDRVRFMTDSKVEAD